MKKMSQGMFVAVILVVLQAAPLLADVTRISGGLTCNNQQDCSPTSAVPVLQGKTTILNVDGQDVNFADKNNVGVSGSGVSATIIKDHLVSPKYGVGTGRAEVSLNVSLDAAGGERTVTLHHNNCLGCPKTYTFKILIIRDGKINDVGVPSPTAFFQQVDIAFSGQRIGNAGVQIIGFPSSTTAQVVGGESNETRAVVRLNFGSQRAEASGQVLLFDKNCSGTCLITAPSTFYDGLTNSSSTNIAIVGPNAVKSITFPEGSSVTVGSLLTFQINLVRPAKGGKLKNQIGLIGGTSGSEFFRWQVAPSNVFEAVPGSGTTFSPTGPNSVVIPAGDTLVRLTVRVKAAPSGCPQSGCSAEIQTRMGNLNSDEPPFFKSARFTIIPGQ